MSVFAIIKNDHVENLVESESFEIVSILLGDESDQIIEVNELTGTAFIGSATSGGRFIPLQPYGSWTFDESSWTWQPPVPAPTPADGVVSVWDESEMQWITITPDAVEVI